MKLTFSYPPGFGINYCKNSYWRKYNLISRVQRSWPIRHLGIGNLGERLIWRHDEESRRWRNKREKEEKSREVPSPPFLIFQPANQVISSIVKREAKYLALVTTFPISWSQLETWNNFYQRFFLDGEILLFNFSHY